MARSQHRAYRVLFGLLGVGVVAACATTKTEADLHAEDRPTIERIVLADVEASKAMTEADSAARKGNVDAALDAIDHRVTPAIEAGLRTTSTAEPKSAWGRSKRIVFTKILEDRRAEITPYTAAVKSGDPSKLIDAVEAQAKIERRAITAVADVNEGR